MNELIKIKRRTHKAPHKQFAKTVGATVARRKPHHPKSYPCQSLRIKICLHVLLPVTRIIQNEEVFNLQANTYSCYYNLY